MYFANIYYDRSFRNPTLSGASIASTSEVHRAVILVLLIHENVWWPIVAPVLLNYGVQIHMTIPLNNFAIRIRKVD
jgi:hypothetical protein